MSRPCAHHRSGPWAGSALAGLMLLAPLPAPAGQNPLYPPAEQLRTLQLTTLACGRDNDSASCDKARAMADPLLDHPRLSATCKDTLWAIRENARTASSNSPQRRERIDRAARDVTVFCRQPNRPAPAAPGGSAPGGSAPGGAPPGGGGSLFSPQS